MNPFERALEIIGQHGWGQGRFVGPRGEVCVGEAIVRAVYEIAGGVALARAELEFAANLCHCPSVADFNDDPATSEEDVRLLLKHAAASWNEQSAKEGWQ